jgi:hypothetical protein
MDLTAHVTQLSQEMSQFDIDMFNDLSLIRSAIICLSLQKLADYDMHTDWMAAFNNYKQHLDGQGLTALNMLLEEKSIPCFYPDYRHLETEENLVAGITWQSYLASLCTSFMQLYRMCNNSFALLLSLFSPHIVADWSRFLSLYPSQKLDTLCLLYYFLFMQDNYQKQSAVSGADGFISPHEYFIREHFSAKFTLLSAITPDSFDSLWNYILFYEMKSKPVKVSGKIKTVLDEYDRLFVPRVKILSDFSIQKKYLLSEKATYNPWQYLRKITHKDQIDSGILEEERLFNLSTFNLKSVQPVELIRASLYGPIHNDSAFECGPLLQEFVMYAHFNCNIVIVNPSPDFILEIADLTDYRSITFVVLSDVLVQLYSAQFKNCSFISLSNISSISEKFDFFLATTRDCSANQVEQILNILSQANEQANALIVLPNSLIDCNDYHTLIRSCLSNFSLQRVASIAPSATHSSPRKKVLLYLKHFAEKDIKGEKLSLEAITCDGKIYQVDKASIAKISQDLFWDSGRTINSLIASPRALAEKEHSRKSASCILFSKEIPIYYSITSDRKNRYAGKAYFCRLLSPAEAKKRQKGKSLTNYIEKGLRQKSEADVIDAIEKNIPFDQRVAPVIIKEIRRFYNGNYHELSLKTVWFCCRTQLSCSKEYNDDIAKFLFCSNQTELSNIIPESATCEDFSKQMDCTIEGSTSVKYHYWTQLNIIINAAIQASFFTHNPISEYVHSLSDQASAEQIEVRNALTKRTFTITEEQKIISFITRKTSTKFESRFAKRFEVESIWLIGAIRLYTGMSIREICALTWRDFIKIPDSETYQFLITKFITDEGIPTSNVSDSQKKFRRIPLVSELSEMLLTRKQYILTFSPERGPTILSEPIILANEKKSHSFCRPKAAVKKSGEIASAAEIPVQLVDLPDIDGTSVQTDLSKYSGDVFRSNFKYRANHTCYLNRGEINYILGVEAPDTFSKHYCDYANDFIQIAMSAKMHRWATMHNAEQHDWQSAGLKTAYCQQSSEEFVPILSPRTSTQFILAPITKHPVNGSLCIEISCKHGFTGNLEVFGEQEDSNGSDRT